MLINEVIRQVDLTRRAVKFYEEKGLIKPSKDSNGYRNYTEEDIQRLKEISVYRKLGISIPDIKRILEGKEEKLLENIYESKKASLQTETKELDALKAFIEGHDIEAAYQEVDYQTIGQAMLDMVPGYFGYYFMQHFQPYLQIRISTPEQQEAYRTILDFWDQTRLHPPLFMTLMTWPMYRLTPRPALDQMIRKMDDQIRMYLNPTAEEYAALKKKTLQNVRLKTGPMKYHPAFIAQRRFMKRMKDCGYYDIFIPAMVELSPKYREYREALMSLNDRICQDLGLYYDSNYNLILKKRTDCYIRYFSSRRAIGLLNLFVISPTQRAAAMVPSRTPSRWPSKSSPISMEIQTRVKSNITFISPNLTDSTLQTANTTPSPALVIRRAVISILTPKASNTIPVIQNTHCSI